jgi:anti-anti-sigma factor
VVETGGWVTDRDGCEEIVIDGPVRVLRLSGELDLLSADPLRRCVAEAFDGGVGVVVLDLSNVQFIDSSGVRAILAANAAAAADGRRVRLVRGPAPVDRVFALLGVQEQLEWISVSELGDAEASLR